MDTERKPHPDRTPIRTPRRISKTDSHERTNERTDVEVGSARKSSNPCDVRAGTAGFTGLTLGELLNGDGKPRRDATIEAVRELSTALCNRNSAIAPYEIAANITRNWDDRYEFTVAQVRWPVLRTGERDPLTLLLRASILRRDQETCGQCGTDMGWETWQREWIEVDHCVPWSAGGPDDSDNLRVLCRGCNQRRSNLIDIAHLRAYRPTTWWCFDCWSTESHDNRHHLTWRNGINLGLVPYVDDEQVQTPVEQAYCAFCRMYGMTTHLLVGDRGRQLVAACEPTPDWSTS